MGAGTCTQTGMAWPRLALAVVCAVALLIAPGWGEDREPPIIPITPVRPLIEQLQSDEPALRIRALKELRDAYGLDKPDLALAAVAKALDDPEPKVRSAAALAAGNIASRRTAGTVVDRLIKALADDDAEVQAAAASALGRVGDKSCVSALVALLEGGKDTTARCRAAAALGRIGDRAAVGPLTQALSHDGTLERLAIAGRAAEALGRIGDPQSLGALTQAAKDKHSALRRFALVALARIDREASLDLLLRGLEDPSPVTRYVVVRHLIGVKDRRALGPLKAALKDASDDVRVWAAHALSSFGKEAVAPLMSALRDPRAAVRWHAAHGLGRIGDRRAVDALIAATGDKEPQVRRYAAWALGRLGDTKAVEAVRAALNRAQSYEDYTMIFRALRELGDHPKWDCPFRPPIDADARP